MKRLETSLRSLGSVGERPPLLRARFPNRIGRRKILIPAIILFSVLSGLSGLATGLVSLLLIRSIMGVTEGSFCPASVAATADASEPKRRGLNQGLQLSAF